MEEGSQEQLLLLGMAWQQGGLMALEKTLGKTVALNEWRSGGSLAGENLGGVFFLEQLQLLSARQAQLCLKLSLKAIGRMHGTL